MDFKPIRKTAFMMYRKCAKQFEYFYLKDPDYDGYKTPDGNQTEAQAKGNLFHQAAEDFFDKLNIETVYQLSDEKVPNYFKSLFPQDSELTPWFEYLVELETRRFTYGRQVYGEKIKEYFKPAYQELKVSLPDIIPRTGHVDRIDYFPKEKALCIVEYKAGKWYNLEKDKVLTEMRAETGWYATILNNNKQLQSPVHYWMCINPVLKQYRVEKFSSITLRALERTYKEIVEAVKSGGPFERSMSPLCLSCKYVSDCLYSLPNGESILGRLHSQSDQDG